MIEMESEQSSETVPEISRYYKVALLVAMVTMSCCINVLLGYRSKYKPQSRMEENLLLILLMEFVKLSISVVILRIKKPVYVINPRNWIMFLIPAGIFVIDNNLVFPIVKVLNPAVYALLMNFKIVTVSIFMRLFIGRRLTRLQSIAIFFIVMGLIDSQLGNDTSFAGKWYGYVGMMTTCCVISRRACAGCTVITC